MATTSDRNGRSSAARRRGWLGPVLSWFWLCSARWRERIDLGELSDERLRDLGLIGGEAAREAARPPWRGADRG